MSIFMRMPLMRVAREVVRAWQFWALLGLLVACGFALQFSSSNTHALVCDWYHDFAEDRVIRGIDEVLGNGSATTRPSPVTDAATTAPSNANLRAQLLQHIKNYFCRTPTTAPATPLQTVVASVGVVVPGAIILAFVITALLPIAPPRAGVTQRVDASIVAISPEQPVVSRRHLRHALAPDSPIDTQMAAGYLNSSVAARQLRVSVTYAVLSSVATFGWPPDYAGPPRTYIPDVGNSHFVAIAAAAVAAAAYATVLFARSKLKTPELAWRLGFGPVFFGGLIATVISLPYQIVRPEELRPMPREQVIGVLMSRCLILPIIGALAVPLLRPILRLDLSGRERAAEAAAPAGH